MWFWLSHGLFVSARHQCLPSSKPDFHLYSFASMSTPCVTQSWNKAGFNHIKPIQTNVVRIQLEDVRKIRTLHQDWRLTLPSCYCTLLFLYQFLNFSFLFSLFHIYVFVSFYTSGMSFVFFANSFIFWLVDSIYNNSLLQNGTKYFLYCMES